MADSADKIDTSAVGNPANPAPTVSEGKGKGKAPPINASDVMDEEDDDSDDDEETGAEDEVSNGNSTRRGCGLFLDEFVG